MQRGIRHCKAVRPRVRLSVGQTRELYSTLFVAIRTTAAKQ